MSAHTPALSDAQHRAAELRAQLDAHPTHARRTSNDAQNLVMEMRAEIEARWGAVERGEPVDLAGLADLERQQAALELQLPRLQRLAQGESAGEQEARWHAQRAAMIEPYRRTSADVRAAYRAACAAMANLAAAARSLTAVVAEVRGFVPPPTVQLPHYGAAAVVLSVEGERLQPVDPGTVCLAALAHALHERELPLDLAPHREGLRQIPAHLTQQPEDS